MRGFNMLAGAAAVVMVLAAFAACGGVGTSSKTPAAVSSTSPRSSPSAGTGSPGALSTSAPAATPRPQSTTVGSISGAGADDLKGVVAKFRDVTFKGSYTLVGAPSDQFSNGQLVLEKDGARNFRIDLTATQNNQDTSIIFIETDTLSVFCLRNAGDLASLFGIDSKQGVCIRNDPGSSANPVGSLSQSITDFANQNVSVIETSTRTVAGQDAKCYKTQDNDTNQVSTTCFRGDGVILYAQSEGDTGSTIEAQSVSKDVSSDDFKAPYDVKDLPGASGGIPTP